MYYTIQENNLLIAETKANLQRFYSNVKKLPEDYDELKYIVSDGTLIRNPNYEEEKEAKEREHIANLTCTKRVLVLMLKQFGVDYFTQIKPLIEANPQAQLEWELCERLLRSNSLLDLMGAQLGITSEQIDRLFLFANNEISQEEFLGE